MLKTLGTDSFLIDFRSLPVSEKNMENKIKGPGNTVNDFKRVSLNCVPAVPAVPACHLKFLCNIHGDPPCHPI